ncbi:MAG TPA: serine protease [Blastocatellia bacterium]|nr:serine protease [Blastocatellia bacterium]
MDKLMFVYLSGSEKGKTRIFTQDHVTLGTADNADLKLVPEGDGTWPDGLLADVYNDDGSYHVVTREVDHLRVTVNGEQLDSELSPAGYPLRDGDTLSFDDGSASASILFQVLPANFAAANLVRREPPALDSRPAQPVHPLTATLFVKELATSLWTEIPRKAKTIAFLLLLLFGALIVTAVLYNFIALHRTATETERLRSELASEADRRREDQDTIKKQQGEIEKVRKIGEQITFAQNIAERYSAGVCLIVGSYSFVERGTGRALRYESADEANDTPVDSTGHLLASVNGVGPTVQNEWTGTGFLVDEGLIITNKHVVQPTANDPLAQIIMRQGAGFRPRLDSLVAFFPSVKTPFEMTIARISDHYDLALCTFRQKDAALPVLPLSSDDVRSIIGEPVVLLGYPTGVDGLLQRIDEGERRSLMNQHGRSAEDVAVGLADKGLVRPLTTAGVISDALPSRVAHSAHTTEGGSGGPLFDRDGRVIAVNQAILTSVEGGQSFGGSNFGVPVKAVTELLVIYRQDVPK